MKTEHEFFSQVDALTTESAVASAPAKSDRLTKLGDLKSKWRAAKGDQVKLQALSDELDGIAGEIAAGHKAKAEPAPAKPADAAGKPATFGKPIGGAAGSTGAPGTSPSPAKP